MFSRLFIVIRRTGWMLLLLSVLTTFIEQILTRLMEKELSSMEGASSMIWIYGASSIILSLLAPVIVSILALSALLPAPIITSIVQHSSYLFRETLRAAGKSLSWSFLLLIPGLIKFLHYAFISFVVILDPEYSAGNKDALAESTNLVKKRFFRVVGIILLFSIAIPLLLTNLDEFAIFDQHPFPAFLLAALDAILSIVGTLMLLKQWENSHGTHVQLETN